MELAEGFRGYGRINEENQWLLVQLFEDEDVWDENIALAWLTIFEPNDYNAYSGFAWDIVIQVEQCLTANGCEQLSKMQGYWVSMVCPIR